jgi:uncharacterized membrane protein
MRFDLRHRPVLLLAILGGVLAGIGLRMVLDVQREAAALGGWCAATLVYSVPTFVVMLRATPDSMRRRAELLDESEGEILTASVAAAIASLAAVTWFVILRAKDATAWEVALSLATIVLSWGFTHLMFAVRYAHEYWQTGSGVAFPGEEEPLFTDFLYLAFTIGMTFQTSDVAFTSRALRQIALLHALVSFLFNVVIIAAAVNVAAGLVG